MKPTCRRICERLAEYADGTLSAADQAEVQRHLEACPPCRVIAGKECDWQEKKERCDKTVHALVGVPLA